MTSSSSSKRDRSGKRHTVSEDSVGFCLRIVTRDDLKDGKKELPPAAVRKYGDELADHICLKVRNCGEPWRIELRTSPRRDRMWLEKGWEEFASFYLLDQGDLATFSSGDEPAHFQVRIFSWDDMEVDYPIHGGEDDVSQQKRKLIRAGAGIEARAISISPGSSTDEQEYNLSRGKGADVSRQKRKETQAGGEVEVEATAFSPRSPTDEQEYNLSHGGGADCSRRKRKKTRAGAEVEARATPKFPRSSAHEHDISQLTSFRSDKPCLNVNIVAASLTSRVFINASFAMEHFCKDGTCCDLTLQNAQGDRIWTVQCITYAMCDGRLRAVMTGVGWKSFRQENHLVEGDALVLEVIEERMCRVSIIRAQM